MTLTNKNWHGNAAQQLSDTFKSLPKSQQSQREICPYYWAEFSSKPNLSIGHVAQCAAIDWLDVETESTSLN